MSTYSSPRPELRAGAMALGVLLALFVPATLAAQAPESTPGVSDTAFPPAPRDDAQDAPDAPDAYGSTLEDPHAATTREAETEALREELRTLSRQPRSLKPGWIVGGLGLAMFAGGCTVFATAFDPETGELNRAGDRGGLVLMSFGSILTIASIGLLAKRARTRRRVARIEEILSHATLTTRLDLRGPGRLELGLATRIAF